ncbi:hypothetical protein O6H91_17G060500 [Diphasiastrum complanatum]|uniref:Uncharacterized protein n=1 Tax=Diphasiastrum complanatum TaxID=34168 RepID=A0ACC2B894_DIPCM|nr:hypothetical protein O6H91_17G060500 [Diphasiastrum complanatum]
MCALIGIRPFICRTNLGSFLRKNIRPIYYSLFKITEAYQCLITGRRSSLYDIGRSATAVVARNGNRGHHIAASLPFVFLIADTIILGGSCIARAYRKEQKDYLHCNPFLP